MSCDHYYVLIPKNFDVEKYLSLSELAGISIKVEEVKKIVSTVQRDGEVHCQDHSYKDGSFDFAVRFLTELGYVLFTKEQVVPDDDRIISMKGHLLSNKQLVEQILKES